MPTYIDKLVTISPAVWPGKELKAQPGDMNLFMPEGIGIGAPLIMRPWDKLEDLEERGSYYGYQRRASHPILDAPRSGASGGTVYFDGTPEREDVDALLRLLRVYRSNKKYAVFVADSQRPMHENFLTMIRVMSPWTLREAFGALSQEEAEKFAEQPVELGELIWKFLEDQQEIYGRGYSAQLSGCMGGDGDWAKETLAFGFMIENEYQGVYRLWSRAWLVTK